jgi:endonuclease G
MSRYVFLFAFLLVAFGLKSDTKFTSFSFLPKSTSGSVIKHTYYALSYSEKHEQPEWVAYYLIGDNGYSTSYKRPRFIKDPKVITQSADINNYNKSGFDRGHLCAAADMKFSKQAFDETFFMSNVTPQRHSFNGGVWKRLEEKVRYWAQKNQGVYIVTGGVLQNDLPTIGMEKVAVPNYFYKVLLSYTNGKYKMIGFLVPHKNSKQPLFTFVVSVDLIEKMTGIDFYSQLNDAVESKLEKQNDYKSWSFN